MIRTIGFRFAVNAMLVLLAALLVFHLSILTGLIPYEIVWGGRLESTAEMRVFELISIAVNLLIMAVIAIKGGYLNIGIPAGIVRLTLWALVALFTLNTVGNLLAETAFERIVFTPLTLVSAILCARLAVER